MVENCSLTVSQSPAWSALRWMTAKENPGAMEIGASDSGSGLATESKLKQSPPSIALMGTVLQIIQMRQNRGHE